MLKVAMKIHFTALFAILGLGITGQAHAYVYSYANHTDETIAIGMKYKNDSEIEYIVMKPQERRAFQPGSEGIPGLKSDIGRNKSSYIASQWYYLLNPPFLNDQNKSTVDWKTFVLTYIESNAYKIALAAGESIGETLENMAKTAQAGASTTLTAAQAQEIVEKAAKKTATGPALQEIENAQYNLATFISKVGHTNGPSLPKNFHTDIIKDENGTIYFITTM